ncbi:hypothetical protein LS71_007170 [Helicobacter jaachi]|uniref:Uncharacterized protein n=1 Tax=Helicobacter jaachi TaxID=1677920 RepID=A0A4U8T8K9_9HELI|nr:hypothetical protein [Helicobacter jaachi]TLD96019.1 hypothetical protein LS71_007170 [Helicobacter jaachi]
MKRWCFLVFLLCMAPNAAFAYLDPGSGSLLLSSAVALFASAVFFVKNLFYKITSFSFGANPIIIGGGGVSPAKPTRATLVGLSFIARETSIMALLSPFLMR